MTIIINGSSGITNVDGSAAAPSETGADTDTGVFYPAADTVGVSTGGTERMRVDSSGNVGIGTASPGYKLDVQGSIGVGNHITTGIGVSTGTTSIELGGARTGDGASFFDFHAVASTDYEARLIRNGGANGTFAITNNGTGDFVLVQANAGSIAFQTQATERMRIDSSGNVGIGQSSITQLFGSYTQLNISGSSGATIQMQSGSTIRANLIADANNFYIYSASSIAFGVGGTGTGTNRMNIDSSGNLLVGTTNTSATAGVGMKFIFSADASNPVIKSVMTDSSGAYSTYNLYCTNASAYRFYVTTAGVVNATTTTITAISDQRLKENIRDLDDGLEKVLALKPRKFDWKENKGENIKNARGFIAQELELVFPDMVTNWIDEPPEGEEPYKAVNANLIPTLVKAIQEQQALITALTARITALENK